MGKKNKGGPNLGKALIRDRFGPSKGRKFVEGNTMLHTTELQDGYDWGRLNLQSVTEESSFQEFLSTAELAGTEFQGEKLNISFVGAPTNVGVLSSTEANKIKLEHEQNKDCLKIPRRPPWNSETTPDELKRLESESFLKWRRSLADLQEIQGLLLTPFEKNLEFWRQLWRVVERSDVVVQIVDARNPLLFRCEDLEKYVIEVSDKKLNLILVNKSDFLTEEQRQIWADYFSQQNVRVAFFSALVKEEDIDEDSEEEDNNRSSDEEERNPVKSLDKVGEDMNKLGEALENTAKKLQDIQNEITTSLKDSKLEDVSKSPNVPQDIQIKIAFKENIVEDSFQLSNVSQDIKNKIMTSKVDKLEGISNSLKVPVINSSDLLTRDDLITLFKNIHSKEKVTQNITTIGLVGYPNVGKSSTINSLMLSKKVSVSATPGKTKHFQTLFLDSDLLLCDCPGLVMPSFVVTKAEMTINGILPIDQMRDHVGPVNLVASLIPRYIFEDRYGLMLPKSEDDESAPLVAEVLLNAYGYNRGFMTANGQPDNPRAARYILKDFVNGKLIYSHAPPTISQEIYHTYPEPSTTPARPLPPREQRAIKINEVTGADVDKVFFSANSKGVHAKGIIGKSSGLPETGSTTVIQGKPWKQINKHSNKKKKEKLRRVYAHLDQH